MIDIELMRALVIDAGARATDVFKLANGENVISVGFFYTPGTPGILRCGNYRLPVPEPVDQEFIIHWARLVLHHSEVLEPENLILDMSMEEYPHADNWERPKDIDRWETCRKCGRKPYVWIYDNGKNARCNCPVSGKSVYFNMITVESIGAYSRRNDGSALGYDWDNLLKAWNAWATGGTDVQQH